MLLTPPQETFSALLCLCFWICSTTFWNLHFLPLVLAAHAHWLHAKPPAGLSLSPVQPLLCCMCHRFATIVVRINTQASQWTAGLDVTSLRSPCDQWLNSMNADATQPLADNQCFLCFVEIPYWGIFAFLCLHIHHCAPPTPHFHHNL